MIEEMAANALKKVIAFVPLFRLEGTNDKGKVVQRLVPYEVGKELKEKGWTVVDQGIPGIEIKIQGRDPYYVELACSTVSEAMGTLRKE